MEVYDSAYISNFNRFDTITSCPLDDDHVFILRTSTEEVIAEVEILRSVDLSPVVTCNIELSASCYSCTSIASRLVGTTGVDVMYFGVDYSWHKLHFDIVRSVQENISIFEGKGENVQFDISARLSSNFSVSEEVVDELLDVMVASDGSCFVASLKNGGCVAYIPDLNVDFQILNVDESLISGNSTSAHESLKESSISNRFCSSRLFAGVISKLSSLVGVTPVENTLLDKSGLDELTHRLMSSLTKSTIATTSIHYDEGSNCFFAFVLMTNGLFRVFEWKLDSFHSLGARSGGSSSNDSKSLPAKMILETGLSDILGSVPDISSSLKRLPSPRNLSPYSRLFVLPSTDGVDIVIHARPLPILAGERNTLSGTKRSFSAVEEEEEEEARIPPHLHVSHGPVDLEVITIRVSLALRDDRASLHDPVHLMLHGKWAERCGLPHALRTPAWARGPRPLLLDCMQRYSSVRGATCPSGLALLFGIAPSFENLVLRHSNVESPVWPTPARSTYLLLIQPPVSDSLRTQADFESTASANTSSQAVLFSRLPLKVSPAEVFRWLHTDASVLAAPSVQGLWQKQQPASTQMQESANIGLLRFPSSFPNFVKLTSRGNVIFASAGARVGEWNRVLDVHPVPDYSVLPRSIEVKRVPLNDSEDIVSLVDRLGLTPQISLKSDDVNRLALTLGPSSFLETRLEWLQSQGVVVGDCPGDIHVGGLLGWTGSALLELLHPTLRGELFSACMLPSSSSSKLNSFQKKGYSETLRPLLELLNREMRYLDGVDGLAAPLQVVLGSSTDDFLPFDEQTHDHQSSSESSVAELTSGVLVTATTPSKTLNERSIGSERRLLSPGPGTPGAVRAALTEGATRPLARIVDSLWANLYDHLNDTLLPSAILVVNAPAGEERFRALFLALSAAGLLPRAQAGTLDILLRACKELLAAVPQETPAAVSALLSSLHSRSRSSVPSPVVLRAFEELSGILRGVFVALLSAPAALEALLRPSALIELAEARAVGDSISRAQNIPDEAATHPLLRLGPLLGPVSLAVLTLARAVGTSVSAASPRSLLSSFEMFAFSNALALKHPLVNGSSDAVPAASSRLLFCLNHALGLTMLARVPAMGSLEEVANVSAARAISFARLLWLVRLPVAPTQEGNDLQKLLHGAAFQPPSQAPLNTTSPTPGALLPLLLSRQNTKESDVVDPTDQLLRLAVAPARRKLSFEGTPDSTVAASLSRFLPIVDPISASLLRAGQFSAAAGWVSLVAPPSRIRSESKPSSLDIAYTHLLGVAHLSILIQTLDSSSGVADSMNEDIDSDETALYGNFSRALSCFRLVVDAFLVDSLPSSAEQQPQQSNLPSSLRDALVYMSGLVRLFDAAALPLAPLRPLLLAVEGRSRACAPLGGSNALLLPLTVALLRASTSALLATTPPSSGPRGSRGLHRFFRGSKPTAAAGGRSLRDHLLLRIFDNMRAPSASAVVATIRSRLPPLLASSTLLPTGPTGVGTATASGSSGEAGAGLSSSVVRLFLRAVAAALTAAGCASVVESLGLAGLLADSSIVSSIRRLLPASVGAQKSGSDAHVVAVVQELLSHFEDADSTSVSTTERDCGIGSAFFDSLTLSQVQLEDSQGHHRPSSQVPSQSNGLGLIQLDLEATQSVLAALNAQVPPPSETRPEPLWRAAEGLQRQGLLFASTGDDATAVAALRLSMALFSRAETALHADARQRGTQPILVLPNPTAAMGLGKPTIISAQFCRLQWFVDSARVSLLSERHRLLSPSSADDSLTLTHELSLTGAALGMESLDREFFLAPAAASNNALLHCWLVVTGRLSHALALAQSAARCPLECSVSSLSQMLSSSEEEALRAAIQARFGGDWGYNNGREPEPRFLPIAQPRTFLSPLGVVRAALQLASTFQALSQSPEDGKKEDHRRAKTTRKLILYKPDYVLTPSHAQEGQYPQAADIEAFIDAAIQYEYKSQEQFALAWSFVHRR